MNTNGSRRIALIVPGGIGTGHNNIGVPVLEQLVKKLSQDFHLTVFSLFKVNPNYSPEGFELISISSSNPLIRATKFLLAFRSNHREKPFHAVHGFWAMPSGFLAVVVGKVYGIRSIVSVLGGDAIGIPEIKYGQLLHWLPRNLIMWALHNADEVISLTQYLVDNLRKVGLKRASVKIIPWGIDTNVFRYRERDLGVPVEFLHIANLHPVKDQETLLKAFKIINDHVSSRLTIIGEGIIYDKIRALISELHLESAVTILEIRPYTELPKEYDRADILLHTSISEGQCEVVTEAMCCGVVVCGTSVGLLYDLPNCCVGVPVRDYQSLAIKTLEIVADQTMFRELREKAHDWAEGHSIGWTIEKLNECYL